MQNRIKPLGSRVLVCEIEPDKVTKSGLHLPDSVNKGRSRKGEVLAVGPGTEREDGTIQRVAVKVGEVVIYSEYTGHKVPGDDNLVLIGEDDLLATITP